MLKVDFDKAYDYVSWDYLRYMMVRLGFGSNWLNKMKEGVFDRSMSVLVNGSSSKNFKVYRGLRKGDLLSPFSILCCNKRTS